MSEAIKVLNPKQGKTIHTVTIRFDMSNDLDAATYATLSQSTIKSHRERLTYQARYLLSVLFGVRKYMGLDEMGLEDIPDLLCLKCRNDLMEQVELEKAMAVVAAARKKRPSLRMVPENAPPESPISA